MTTEIQMQFERYTLENMLRREREGIPLDRTNAILRILEENKYYFPLTVIRTQNEYLSTTLLSAYRINVKAGASEPALYVFDEALYTNDGERMARCIQKPFPERLIRELLSILSEKERAEEAGGRCCANDRREVIPVNGIFLFRYLADRPMAPGSAISPADGFRQRIFEFKPIEAGEIKEAKERFIKSMSMENGRGAISDIEVHIHGGWKPLEVRVGEKVLPMIVPRMFSSAASVVPPPVLMFRR